MPTPAVDCGDRHYRTGICDECGGKLVHRKDDHEDAVAKQVDAYEAGGLPALEELHALRPDAVIDISAESSIADVCAEVAAALEVRGFHLQIRRPPHR